MGVCVRYIFVRFNCCACRVCASQCLHEMMRIFRRNNGAEWCCWWWWPVGRDAETVLSTETSRSDRQTVAAPDQVQAVAVRDEKTARQDGSFTRFRRTKKRHIRHGIYSHRFLLPNTHYYTAWDSLSHELKRIPLVSTFKHHLDWTVTAVICSNCFNSLYFFKSPSFTVCS